VSGTLEAMAKPGTYDLTIYQGDTFSLRITLVDKATGDPVDLTGYDPLSQIRAKSHDRDALATFDAEVDPAAGVITLKLASADSTALPPGRQVWDVQTTDPDGNVRTWLAGKATVTGQVSRV
jgi:hypothetical protein